MAIEFNTQFYLQSKFNQLEAAGRLEEFGLTDVASLEQFFTDNNVDAEAHYLTNGMAEGINPSPEFDTNAYLAAKLEQLQGEQFEGQYADLTIEGLIEIFQANGLTPLAHYNQFGINEGIEPQVPSEATEGETVELTTSTDELTGTALDDTFNAVASALSSERTLNPDDSIDGGEGNDTLNVTLNSSFAGFSSTGGVENVETLNLSNSGSIARNFNAANITGVNAINLQGSVNLQNLEALGASIGIADTTSNVSIGIAESAAEGSDDTLNLALSNVGSVAADGDVTAAAISANVGSQAVENLSINAAGVNAVNLNGVAVDTFTVTGNGALTLTDVGDGLEALDASAAEGDINATLSGADAASVMLGSGNDVLNAAVADLTTNAVINGGEGQNRLVLTNAGTTTTQYQMSNIQSLVLDGAGTATFSARDVQGLETLTLDDAYSATTTVARLGAQDLNLNVVGTAAGALTLDHSGVTVVDVVPETDATASQTATTALTLTNSTAVDLYVGEDSVYTGNVIANQAESLEVAVEGQLNNQLTATNATGAVFNLQNADDASTVDLEANKLVSLDVTAAGDADFNGSTLNGLEALVVNTAGNFQTNAALGAINQIELSGSGAATLSGALGAADQDEYGITVNATGLNDGLTLGTINTNGTNITVNAADVLGTVDLGAINARSGDVNVDLSNVGGAINVGTLEGANVTVDATGALGTVNYNGAITASESVTLNGAELAANTATINSGSTSFTGTLNGGLKADDYTVNLTNTDATSFNLSGDLGLGTDELTITLYEQTNAGEVTAIYNVAGVETLNFELGAADDDTVTLTAASSLAGVETLTVTNGTVDISAVTDFTGNKVEVASGIKMTASQFANIQTVTAKSETARIDVSINSAEDAQQVKETLDAIKNANGGNAVANLNIGLQVASSIANDNAAVQAVAEAKTAANAAAGGAVTEETVDDSGNTVGDVEFSGTLTVKQAEDAGDSLGSYSLADTATNIESAGAQLISDADQVIANMGDAGETFTAASSSEVTEKLTLNGGADTDMLKATLDKVVAYPTHAPTLSSVETVSLTSNLAGAGLMMTNATGVTSIVNDASTSSLSVIDVTAKVDLKAVGVNSSFSPLTGTWNDSSNFVVRYSDAEAAPAIQNITLENSNLNLLSVTALASNVDGETVAALAGITELAITSSGEAANSIRTFNEGEDGLSASLETVTIDGSQALTIIDLPSGITVNAADATGELYLVVNGSEATTITGGTANDTLFGGAGNDIITGGDGNDVIYGREGADIMTGGAGNDTFVIATDGVTSDAADIVMDFGGSEGTDADQLNFAVGGQVGENWSKGSSAVDNFDAALSAANAAFDTDSVDSLAVNAQQVGSDLWVFADTTGDSVADTVVQLTGVSLESFDFNDVATATAIA